MTNETTTLGAQGGARRWALISFWFILVVGITLRVYQFPHVPAGLNQDELSAGYESWSLLQFGTDRWGAHLPAYFLSWGSGMNVLYSYLTIPFVALFGLTAVAVRMVALLAGILLLPLLYVTVKRWSGQTQALLAMGALAVMPWGWMTSRWGLESNLLPVFLLLGVYALTVAVGSNARTWQRLLALVPFAVALYAYGLGLPTIVTFLVLAGIRYRHTIGAHVGAWLIAAGLALLVAVPFLLFFLKAYIVKGALPFEQWLPFTLPTLTETRLDQVDSALGGFPPLLANTVLAGSGFQDGSIWNSLPGYATIPLLLILLAGVEIVVNIVKFVRARKLPRLDMLALWFLACVPLFCLLVVNVNQANALYLPLIVIAVRGGMRVTALLPQVRLRTILTVIMVLAVAVPSLLGYRYYVSGEYTTSARQSFNPELAQALPAAARIVDGKPLYITTNIPLAYMQTLWYMHIPATTFQAAHPNVVGAKNFKNFVFDATNPTLNGYYFLGIGQEKPQCPTYALVRQLGDYSLGYCS